MCRRPFERLQQSGISVRPAGRIRADVNAKPAAWRTSTAVHPHAMGIVVPLQRRLRIYGSELAALR